MKLKQAPDRMCACATSVLGAGRDAALWRTERAAAPWASANISAPLGNTELPITQTQEGCDNVAAIQFDLDKENLSAATDSAPRQLLRARPLLLNCF